MNSYLFLSTTTEAEKTKKYRRSTKSLPGTIRSSDFSIQKVKTSSRAGINDGVASRMCAALEKAGTPVPLYLKRITQEYSYENHGTAVFTFPCFWSGEVALGKRLKNNAGRITQEIEF